MHLWSVKYYWINIETELLKCLFQSFVRNKKYYSETLWIITWSAAAAPTWQRRKSSGTTWSEDIWISCFECSNQLPTSPFLLAALPFPNVFCGLFSIWTLWTEPVKFSKHLLLLWSPAACCSYSCWRTTESSPMRWTTTTTTLTPTEVTPSYLWKSRGLAAAVAPESEPPTSGSLFHELTLPFN